MIFSAVERFIAFRYLRARRAEGFISVSTFFSIAGIALGVATLIMVTSVMNGVRDEMMKQFIGLSGHINIYGGVAPIQNYDAMSLHYQERKDVLSATPVIEGQVMVSSSGRAIGAQVMAYKDDDIKRNHEITDKITIGSIDSLVRGEGVIIGERMAENLGLSVGDSITLISPEGRQTIAGLVPRIKSYPIIGLFKFGMHAYDSALVLMPFSEAQTYFKLTDNNSFRVSSIQIKLKNPDLVNTVSESIKQELGNGYRVYSWVQSNKAVFNALNIQRSVMFIILTLIIIVAAFNIISSLVMLVKEKGRDIAILRSMGATRGTVHRIFILCGMSIGFVGTFIGVVLGLLLAVNIDHIREWVERISNQQIMAQQLYFLSTLPSKVDVAEVLGIIAMSLTLSFLAALYPARRAASLEPSEALRYE